MRYYVICHDSSPMVLYRSKDPYETEENVAKKFAENAPEAHKRFFMRLWFEGKLDAREMEVVEDVE